MFIYNIAYKTIVSSKRFIAISKKIWNLVT